MTSEIKTLKIPSELHADLRVRAAKERKLLQDVVIEILTNGLKED